MIDSEAKRARVVQRNDDEPSAELDEFFRVHGRPVRLFGETEAERVQRHLDVLVELSSSGSAVPAYVDGVLDSPRTAQLLMRLCQLLLTDDEEQSLVQRLSAGDGEDDGKQTDVGSALAQLLATDPARRRPSERQQRMDDVAASLAERCGGYERLCSEQSDWQSTAAAGALAQLLAALRLWCDETAAAVRAIERGSGDVRVPRAVAIREAVAGFRSVYENMRPVLDGLLPGGLLPPRIVDWLVEVLAELRAGRYRQATQVYMALAIGNAPWPIGATMVGIHERSAREKLFSEKVVHVLDSESQKRAILSIKSLITWQEQYNAKQQKKQSTIQ